jgi:hypothetical protein
MQTAGYIISGKTEMSRQALEEKHFISFIALP